MSGGPAYYNEHDREKAAWLRELIRRGLIAPGDVDERDILDVIPSELAGYRQCHFFAGVGIWSYALRCAGWDDSRPVWTVSCPCQPFSAAGKGAGFADERHLWPAWFHLASQCRPDVCFGEQVASDDAGPWIDLVHSDMEALGYAFGPVVFPAAGVGAPHGRHRLYFVADAPGQRHNRRRTGEEGRRSRAIEQPERFRDAGQLADALRDGSRGRRSGTPGEATGRVQGTDGERQRVRPDARPGRAAVAGGVGNAESDGRREREHSRDLVRTAEEESGHVGLVIADRPVCPGPTNGFWADAEWLPCRDGKARPVEPGSFPLAHGAPARVVRLRGYGDGIVAAAAEAFIRAYLESMKGP